MELRRRVRSIALFKPLGAGLVTGAADGDPSGIATYSQAGAQFGYGLLWTLIAFHFADGLIHFLLVIAVIAVILDFVTGRRVA